MPTLKVEDWGLIDYEQALAKQLEYVDQVAKNPDQGFLIFCTHPPVVTLGRKTKDGDVFAWNGPVIEVSRGGRATYHGPSQLVVYPIFKINDIHKYLTCLEHSIIEALAYFGVNAIGKNRQKTNGETSAEETGVWVGQKKIASLGIGIKKWVTYHGAAINLENDPFAFLGLKPCGFSKETMVNLEKLIEQPVPRHLFQELLINSLAINFQKISASPLKLNLHISVVDSPPSNPRP